MRISTASFYNASLPGIQSQQSAIARLNQQIATNQNYLAPKDNPVATNQIVALTESIALRNQYLSNIQKADLALKQQETVLDGMQTALEKVQSLLYQISPSHDQGLRDQIAKQLADLYLHIKDLANSKDSAGNYIFAGYETDTLPFDHSATYPATTASLPTAYDGDTGVRSIEIDQGQRIATNEILTGVFQIGGTPDLLQAIDQAAIDLADSTITQPALSASLQSYAGVLNTALDRLQVTRNSVIGRTVILDDVKSAHLKFKLNDQNALGALQDLDQAAAIVELQQRQVSLQASMQAFSTVSGLSLFNYLR